MSISTGLNVAMRALLTHQRSVDTVSHNIANATTAGYSRQRVKLAAVVGSGEVGSPGGGVMNLGAERVRNTFLDFQIRDGSQTRGRYEARAQSLGQAELSLGEPGDSGLRAMMGNFFNAWRDLANEPESGAARSAVVQAGGTVAATGRRIYDSLVVLRKQADQELGVVTSEINAITTRVADLNQQIVMQRAQGDDAPDLSDERDRMVDRLSELMDVTYQEDAAGNMTIFVGGSSLVTGPRARVITGTPNVANSNFVDLTFADNGTPLLISDGRIKGLLEQRDTDLVGRIADLNTLIGQIVTDVNTAHAAGFAMDTTTGHNFFSGTDASDIAIDATIVANPNLVSAATTVTGAPGDGGNASVISDLEYAQSLLGGTATYDDFYSGFVSSIGVATRETESLLESQSLVLEQLDQMRQGASGINLDEEMIQLMEYQRAYEAAGRMVSIFDEMLDLVINGMS